MICEFSKIKSKFLKLPRNFNIEINTNHLSFTRQFHLNIINKLSEAKVETFIRPESVLEEGESESRLANWKSGGTARCQKSKQTRLWLAGTFNQVPGASHKRHRPLGERQRGKRSCHRGEGQQSGRPVTRFESRETEDCRSPKIAYIQGGTFYCLLSWGGRGG